jgi:oligogalacturonide transport system permease protein
MVLYLAGLKQVPGELYESAKIDGAGPVRRFFKITLPMISPIIFFTLIMQMIMAFQDFTAPMLVTSGGPAKATYLYGLMLYDNAFRFFKMGYASALSWILFIIIVIITVVIFKFSNVMVYYQDEGNDK